MDRHRQRERRTVHAMVDLACRERHAPGDGLCCECGELKGYADARLERCPYGASKPTCANCPIHCYKPTMRERMRDVMRYAGPRMLRVHPILAIRHLLDGLRKPPELARPVGGSAGAAPPDPARRGAPRRAPGSS